MTGHGHDRTQADRERRRAWISVAIAIGTIVVEVARETFANVLANNMHVATGWLRHEWLYAVLVTVSVLGIAGTAWFMYRWRVAERAGDDVETGERSGADREPAGQPPGPARPSRAFPQPVRLAGHHDADRQTAAARARKHGVAVVTGVAGSGASAVGIAAGWELTPDPARQRYVDLSGSLDHPENQRRTLIRVLRVLGVRPGAAADPRLALAAMADTLRGTGTVLMLDNAERADQISWLLGGVPGAYVIACGDIRDKDGRELPGRLPGGCEPVKVRPLARRAVLDLLTRQGDSDSGGPDQDGHVQAAPRGPLLERVRTRARARIRALFRPRSARQPRHQNPVRARIDAEPEAAYELAGYLRLPRVAIDMGRWLAANPHVALAALVADLRSTEPNAQLALILRRQLDGASPGARRLLALLAAAATTELPQAAVAKLAGTGLDRTADHLAELASRSLVEWPRLSKCRITPQARQLARDPGLAGAPGRKAVAKSQARLAAYYARLAVAYAGTLDADESQEWLRAEDATLLQVLGDQRPPASAAGNLWLIAEALDAWFAREQRPEDRQSAAAAMERGAAVLEDSEARVIACLRLAAVARDGGDFTADGRNLEHAEKLAGRSTALQVQVHNAWTAHFMTTGDLDAAGDHLLRCRDIRPRRDRRGRVTDFLNQAGLELRRGAVDAAEVTLGQAQVLAAEVADPVSQAHAHELSGIAAARAGQQQRADREWERALTQYKQAGDVTGQARCLQHQGTIEARPDGDARAAAELLDRSLELRGDHRTGLGPGLAHLYLMQAGQPAAGHRAAGLAALASWPHQGSEPQEVTIARHMLAEPTEDAAEAG